VRFQASHAFVSDIDIHAQSSMFGSYGDWAFGISSVLPFGREAHRKEPYESIPHASDGKGLGLLTEYIVIGADRNCC
jgi:hypothetical protein